MDKVTKLKSVLVLVLLILSVAMLILKFVWFYLPLVLSFVALNPSVLNLLKRWQTWVLYIGSGILVEIVRISSGWWNYVELFDSGIGLLLMILLGYPLFYLTIHSLWILSRRITGKFLVQVFVVYLLTLLVIDAPNVIFNFWVFSEQNIYMYVAIYIGYLLEAFVPVIAEKIDDKKLD